MPRHNDDARDLIRERVDLRDLVGEHVDLRRAGGDRHVGLCPFHAEKTPSLTVWSDHLHCYGCGVHHDIFGFVMAVRSVPFTVALAELANRAGVPLERGARRRPLGPTPRDVAFAEREAAYQGLVALRNERDAITADVAGSPALEAWAIECELPDLAARELRLIVRFDEATRAAAGDATLLAQYAPATCIVGSDVDDDDFETLVARELGR